MFDLFLLTNVQALLVFVTVFLIGYYYLKSDTNGKYKLPPGPGKFPIVGSLPYLGSDVREPLQRLAAKYGDVFTVYLGSRCVVMLNTYEAVKEAFVKNGHAFAGRPQDLFWVKEMQQGLGVVSTQGPLWKEQRKFVHGVFRDMGVGRSMMEATIQEEVVHLIKAFKEEANAPVNPHALIQMAVANVIYSTVFGTRNDYKDPKFIRYMEIMNTSFEVVGNAGVITVFPFLRHLPGDPFKIKLALQMSKEMRDEFQGQINKHRETYVEGTNRDFIDAYLQQMKMEELQEDSTFHEEQLISVIGDLFGAGTETTTTTLTWSMIYLLHHPHVQREVQKEIDRVIGTSRLPTMKDKVNMPYTEACLLEIQRLAVIVPLGVPHCTLEDIEFRGYTIPKGTDVMSNLYSVHRDPAVWQDAYTFRPERFLDEEGNLNKREKEWIPFSMGKRVCLGESMAKMETFVTFTTLLQHFTFTNPPNKPLPDLKGNLSITNLPPAFTVLLESRNNVVVSSS